MRRSRGSRSRMPLGGVWILAVSAVCGCDGRQSADEAPRASAPPVPPFTFQLDVHGASAAAPFPVLWQSLRISSMLTFEYVPPGRPDQQCVAEHRADDLNGVLRYREFRALLDRLPRTIWCEPCASCASLTLEWSLAGERDVLRVSDTCWHTHPDLQKLRTAVEGVVAAAYGRVVCNGP